MLEETIGRIREAEAKGDALIAQANAEAADALQQAKTRAEAAKAAAVLEAETAAKEAMAAAQAEALQQKTQADAQVDAEVAALREASCAAEARVIDEIIAQLL